LQGEQAAKQRTDELRDGRRDSRTPEAEVTFGFTSRWQRSRRDVAMDLMIPADVGD